MELEEIIKPYSLAPDSSAKRGAPRSLQGPPKRHQNDIAATAGDAGALQGKVFVEDLPDEIDASAVEKILEQADEVCITKKEWHYRISLMFSVTRLRCYIPPQRRQIFVYTPAAWVGARGSPCILQKIIINVYVLNLFYCVGSRGRNNRGID